MSQSWIFILQISSSAHIHKKSTPINVWSERYFQDDHLTYFLLSKARMGKKQLPLHPSKANYYRATFYLKHLIFYSLILTDEKSPILGVTDMVLWLAVYCHRVYLYVVHMRIEYEPVNYENIKHSHRKLISTMLIRINSLGSSFLWAYKGSLRRLFTVEMTGWIILMENILNPHNSSRSP